MSIRNSNGESVDGGITKAPDVPNAPTSPSAADVGTSRAYNNGAPINYVLNEDTCQWEEVE